MDNEFILRMVGISKIFPGAKALNEVDFDLKKGEVHALAGENGAGKSTLIKILAGVHRPDGGQIWLNGEKIDAQNTKKMLNAGISVIYQELNLIPHLSVAENVFLGREPVRKKFPGLIDWREMYEKVNELMKLFNLNISPTAKVNSLGIAHQQVVEIVKAISIESDIIVMDEPTATLTGQEVDKLFEIIDTLKRKKVSIIYISHRLEEIKRIADRVTVLRDGQKILTDDLKNLEIETIIKLMVGRNINEQYPKENIPPGEELLKVEQLSRKNVCENISFNLKRGEILGIAGLVGAGRTEMVELLFGYQRKDSGKISIRGIETKIKNPQDAVRQGIGLIPEERKKHGLVLALSLYDNMTLSVLDRFSSWGFLKRIQLKRSVNSAVRDINIKTFSIKQPVNNLSGGNQQKVVLAKWFLRNCQIYIFDEPTRGIDVGAKLEIYRLMERLANKGVGIIMISSELPELLNMSDRILVMCDGKIVKELRREEASEESILCYAIGGG